MSKDIYQHSETTHVIDQTGEILETQRRVRTTTKISDEPSYVKLYLDCISRFKGMQVSFNPILIKMLAHASFANDGGGNGQIVYMNKALKKRIADECEVSIKRVEQAITEFVKKKLIKRIDTATYQFDPFIFGKGEWKDIQNIRATFDFANSEIIAEIVKSEEEEMTEHQTELEKRYNELISDLELSQKAANE